MTCRIPAGSKVVERIGGKRADPERRRAAVERLGQLREAGELTAAHVRLAASGLGVRERTVWRWLRLAAGQPGTPAGRGAYQLSEADREAYARYRGNMAAVHRARSAVLASPAAPEVPAAGVPVPASLREGWRGAPPAAIRTLQKAFRRELTAAEAAAWAEGEEGQRAAGVYLTRPAGHRNQTWEMDHKQLPILVMPPRGAACCPWLTSVIDDATRVLAGWAIALTPHAGTVLTAVRMALVHDPARGPFGAILAATVSGRGSYNRPPAAEPAEGSINVRVAREQLQRVLYQRTAMSGWTTSLKASYISIGNSASMTEAEAPLVMPDIVERIKEIPTSNGPALICIDELDKLDSADEARAFLNEIKGVFEASKTHFLVSMSEDAIASFERRGLPFRDVFDSAFDEVVPVPYLSLQQSRQLLSETVVGMPPPFVDLSHCLAGGLVRDVIRNARRLANHGGPLAQVAERTIHAEIEGKVDAIIAAAKPIPLEPTVTLVLRELQNLDHCRAGHSECCVLSTEWLDGLAGLDPQALQASGDDVPHLRSLLRLASELTVFEYYCRTLLETFRVAEEDQLNRLIEAGKHSGIGSLDQLARARQEFAVNPFIAWDDVTSFRKAIDITAFVLS